MIEAVVLPDLDHRIYPEDTPLDHGGKRGRNHDAREYRLVERATISSKPGATRSTSPPRSTNSSAVLRGAGVGTSCKNRCGATRAVFVCRGESVARVVTCCEFGDGTAACAWPSQSTRGSPHPARMRSGL
jgi:hypothetical protein